MSKRKSNKLVLFSEGCTVPEEFKKYDVLAESIFNVNKENISTVFSEIPQDLATLACNMIFHAIKIRPLQSDNLRTLFSLLKKKYSVSLNLRKVENSDYGLEDAIKADDIETFIKLTSDPSFNHKELIKTTIEVDFRGRGFFSAIHLAALLGSVKCFKQAMLTGDYDINYINKYAIAGGNSEIIHILEQNNVSFNNCLGASIMYHRDELSDWLLMNYKCEKVKLSQAFNWYNIKFFFFCINQNDYNQASINEAFTEAIAYGSIELVKYFYEKHHADVETEGDSQCTPINLASLNGYLDIVKYLYETCHADVESKGRYGCTPISIAASEGHLDVVKYLYETCHADTEAKDVHGDTPVNHASENGHVEVVKYLCETCHGDCQAKNKFGWTPVTSAACRGHLGVIKYLYETCHVNVEAKNHIGAPIHLASRDGHLDVVKYLHETCHVNVETKNFEGDTPIKIASKNDHFDIVKYLYEKCHVKVPNDILKKAKNKNFTIVDTTKNYNIERFLK